MSGGNEATSSHFDFQQTSKAGNKLDPDLALSRINGMINRMKPAELKQRLNEVGLYNRGVQEVLRRRLKNYYKAQKLTCSRVECQFYPRLVVIDFEATCEEENPEDYLHEIIEFPAVLIDTEACRIVDQFHRFCRPTERPHLSEFCKGLTGISQSQVDEAPLFPQALSDFENWLSHHNLTKKGQCAFVTDGCWDFSRFLNIQCCLNEIPFPKWAREWVNVKKIYGNFYKLKRPRIMDMLTNLGLEHEGRLHSGEDDARNLARIVIRLIQDGAKLQLNEKLQGGKLRFIHEGEKLMIAERQVRRLGLKPPHPPDAGDVDTKMQSLSVKDEDE